jgi:hypothetical protein
MERPASLGRRADSLIEQLAFAQRADDSVVGGGVEGDDGAGLRCRANRPGSLPAIAYPAQRRRKNQTPTRLPLTNQVTLWRPI